MGATKIMVIRHAEKPDKYNGQYYSGVDATGTQAGPAGTEHLTTLGWERAGGLVTLFAPPWGPKGPTLTTPQSLFASNPTATGGEAAGDDGAGPSQRPYETLTAVAAALGLSIDTSYAANDYASMVKAALNCEGVVLIAWQHELIPWWAEDGSAGISQCIITQTQTQETFPIPDTWPSTRYDLVWAFDRPTGSGPITAFSQSPQFLLADDKAP